MPVLRRMARDRDAATVVEFAFAAPVLIALLVATLEIALVFVAQQALETTTETAARYILTGQAQTTFTGVKDSTGKVTKTARQQFQDYACSILPPMLTCGNLYVDVTSVTSYSAAKLTLPTITYDKFGNVSNSFNYSPGTQGAIVAVRMMYMWPVLSVFGFNIANQPHSRRMLIATSIMKTEGY